MTYYFLGVIWLVILMISFLLGLIHPVLWAILFVIYILYTLWIQFALFVRKLQDINLSGRYLLLPLTLIIWWVVLNLNPLMMIWFWILFIYSIMIYFTKGTNEINQYWADPLLDQPKDNWKYWLYTILVIMVPYAIVFGVAAFFERVV